MDVSGRGARGVVGWVLGWCGGWWCGGVGGGLVWWVAGGRVGGGWCGGRCVVWVVVGCGGLLCFSFLSSLPSSDAERLLRTVCFSFPSFDPLHIPSHAWAGSWLFRGSSAQVTPRASALLLASTQMNTEYCALLVITRTIPISDSYYYPCCSSPPLNHVSLRTPAVCAWALSCNRSDVRSKPCVSAGGRCRRTAARGGLRCSPYGCLQ